MHFFLKLLPPRASFVQDMTADERNIMMQHVAYMKQLADKDIALVYGPVFDPSGGYGVGVFNVESEEELKEIISKDPANGLNRYEYFPMQAVMKEKS